MQAVWEGRLVCIEQPELLEHIFLLAHDRDTQAALLRTSKAWAAAGKRCCPVQVAIGLAEGACWSLDQRRTGNHPANPALHSLPAAAAWLAQERRLVVSLRLQLDPFWCKWNPVGTWSMAESPSLLRLNVGTEQARAVLEAVPGLASLSIRSVCDMHWLPRLSALTSLSMDCAWEPEEYAGGIGPLDCIAHIAPQLRDLSIATYWVEDDDDPPFLSPGSSLPPSLTSLDVEGLAEGLETQISQLERLTWYPLDGESWVDLSEEAVQGLSQACRLTRLALTNPCPPDVPEFLGSLACLTGLCDLSLSAVCSDGSAALFNRQYYETTEEYNTVLHKLLPEALAGLTRLTYLSLTAHDMPACPATLSYLPALAWLELGFNEALRELPHGPWPALERLQVDQELIDAALADQPARRSDRRPGLVVGGTFVPTVEVDSHALWGMRRLTRLEVFWMDSEEEEQEDTEKKRTIRRLLPQLQSL